MIQIMIGARGVYVFKRMVRAFSSTGITMLAPVLHSSLSFSLCGSPPQAAGTASSKRCCSRVIFYRRFPTLKPQTGHMMGHRRVTARTQSDADEPIPNAF